MTESENSGRRSLNLFIKLPNFNLDCDDIIHIMEYIQRNAPYDLKDLYLEILKETHCLYFKDLHELFTTNYTQMIKYIGRLNIILNKYRDSISKHLENKKEENFNEIMEHLKKAFYCINYEWKYDFDRKNEIYAMLRTIEREV